MHGKHRDGRGIKLMLPLFETRICPCAPYSACQFWGKIAEGLTQRGGHGQSRRGPLPAPWVLSFELPIIFKNPSELPFGYPRSRPLAALVRC